MITNQIINRSELHWDEVIKNVKDALVFMDDAAAELLHWHGGLKRMFDGGALSVENFTPFVKADSKVKKAVFVIMSPLVDDIWRTLMVIIRANSFKHCIVITPLPEKYHSEEITEAEHCFTKIENCILSWMENKNYTASICHIPLFSAYISKNVFIMPSFSKKFSIFNCGLLEMNRRRTEELSLKSLNVELETFVRHLAYSLSSLLDTFQVKGDFFSLGPLSNVLASELENISHLQKRKTAFSNKVSVVIVDRILDLAGPLSQSYETMFDKMLHTLPHLPGHIFDVSVNMKDMAACKNDIVFGRPLLAPGCIGHKSNSYEEANLNAILFKNPREVLIDINRNVVECAAKEEVMLDSGSRITTDSVRKKVIAFKEKQKSLLKFSGLLQQTLAVIQTLEYAASNKIDNLAAIEKALLQYMTTSGEEVLNNIMQMIAEKDEMNYKMEEIIIFLAFFYMLSCETDLANESSMQGTLMESFFQDEDMREVLSLFVNEDLKDDEHVLNSVKILFDVFKRLGSTRKRLKKYSNLFMSQNPAFPASYNPLLKQLLDDIFDSSLTDIPDIEFHSAGLRDYIKTGFSLFLNVTKSQPRDNPVIFLIVLGGVTPAEIKLVHEISSRHKDKEIILGCTDILSPSDVLENLGMIVKELAYEAYENEM